MSGINVERATATASAPTGSGFRFMNLEPESVNSGTDSQFANGRTQVSQMFIPVSFTMTGIGFLLGTVGGTTGLIVILYGPTGTVLATSALAGTTAGSSGTYQKIPFTAPYAVTGPDMYHVGIQANGAVARFKGTNVGGEVILTRQISGGVFGTIPALTPPTAYAEQESPYFFTY